MSFGIHFVDGFFNCVRAGTHKYDYVFCVFCADVVEKVIASAGELINLVHHFLYDGGGSVVVFVSRFPVLEVDIGVLRGTSLNGMFGIKRSLSEFFDVVHIYESFHFVVVDYVDLGNFVRSS